MKQQMMDFIGRNKPNLIGIDGCGAAGKSSLAQMIQKEYPIYEMIHMDDFYQPSHQRKNLIGVGHEYDINRLLKEVILPYQTKNEIAYEIYNWEKDELDNLKRIPKDKLLLIEGVYSLNTLLLSYYDLKIWVDAPKTLRIKRGILRDGKEALNLWLNWMALEDNYLMEQHPEKKVDFIIKGY